MYQEQLLNVIVIKTFNPQSLVFFMIHYKKYALKVNHNLKLLNHFFTFPTTNLFLDLIMYITC